MDYYIHDLSPFLWRWGGTDWGIRYYGLAYVLGFLVFYFGMIFFSKRKWISINTLQISDLVVWCVIGVIIGGRLGYCMVYDLPHTLSDPLSIVAFWRGGISGMSSHGGMLGAVAAMWLFSRKIKCSFWELADHAAILSPIGIFLGRIANFINGELWGRVTDVPWAVIFPAAGVAPRHPSQLYEAFGEGAFLFGILFFLRWRGWKDGKISAAFLFIYGIVRICLEQFREPDKQLGFLFGWTTMGQLLSILMIIASIILWITVTRARRKFRH